MSKLRSGAASSGKGTEYIAPDGAGDLLGFGSYKDSAPTDLFQRDDPEGNGDGARLAPFPTIKGSPS